MHTKNIISISIIFLFLSLHLTLHAQNHYQVYFFLLEDCKITQAYIPEINTLQAEFESDSIEFKAFFPNPSSNEQLMAAFYKEYQPGLPCVLDENQAMAKKFNILVMPEVVIYQDNKSRLLYQGRIDNLFAAPGKRRAKATKHELRDCLNKIQKALAIQYLKTDAVGCYLTPL
jgi:hypothetical protein